MKVSAPVVEQNIDTSSEITFQWCMQRRGVALDQSRLIAWATHQTWQPLLRTHLRVIARLGSNRLSKADRELFTIMANEIKGSLRPDTIGKMPMDEALELLRVDARVTMHLLPLLKGRSSNDKRALEDVDPKVKKAPKPKKPPTKKAAFLQTSSRGIIRGMKQAAIFVGLSILQQVAKKNSWQQVQERSSRVCQVFAHQPWSGHLQSGRQENVSSRRTFKGVHGHQGAFHEFAFEG